MSGVVIKAGDARVLSRGMYSLDLRDISRQADDMLTAARKEARRVIAQAHQEAESQQEVIRQTAHRDGYTKGLTEGRAAGEDTALSEARERFSKDQASLVSSLTELLDAFSDQRERMYLAARRDVVVLAIAIARRFSRRFEVMEDVTQSVAVDACHEALDLLHDATEAVIRVHPEDWSAVERFTRALDDSTRSSRHVRVLKDASIKQGGVTVETANSTIDATVASRVDRIADELVTDWRSRMKTLSIES